MNMELIVLGINYFIILLIIFLVYKVANKIANSYKEKNKKRIRFDSNVYVYFIR